MIFDFSHDFFFFENLWVGSPGPFEEVALQNPGQAAVP